MEEKHHERGTMDPSQIDGETSVLDKNPTGWPKNYWSDPIWEWVVRNFEFDCRREVVIKIAKIIYMGIDGGKLKKDLLPQATILACIAAAQFQFEKDIPIAPIRKCCEKLSIDIRNVLTRIIGMKNKPTAPDSEIDTWRTLSLTKEVSLKIKIFEGIIKIPEPSEDANYCFGIHIMDFTKTGIYLLAKNRNEVQSDFISRKMLDVMNSNDIIPEVRFIALNQSLLFSQLKHSDFMMSAAKILGEVRSERRDSNVSFVKDQKISWFIDLILLWRFK